jgi:Zn-finger nucleic acid-binding protein
MWLDRGELDRLIERAAREERGAPPPRAEALSVPERSRHEREPERHHDDERYRRQRKPWLGKILDFD